MTRNMKDWLKSLWRLQRRIRSLRNMMQLRDAVRVARTEETRTAIHFLLIPSGRKVTLRGGTSDSRCFDKIFLANEYATPFPAQPKVIVDAGANIGLATLFYSQEYPDAKIIAIEPESSNFKLLKTNCDGLPNVTPVGGALWHEEVTLKIKDNTADKWAFSVTGDRSVSQRATQDVAGLTIPGILRDFELERIDILKLDIEGAEYELFTQGASQWLGKIEQIVIELHDRYRPGCARAFYAAISHYSFNQEIRGENIFVKFEH